jgi:hypothetical protein
VDDLRRQVEVVFGELALYHEPWHPITVLASWRVLTLRWSTS